jgi:hypothetical protein
MHFGSHYFGDKNQLDIYKGLQPFNLMVKPFEILVKLYIFCYSSDKISGSQEREW